MFEDVPLFLLPLPGPVPGLQQPSAAVKAVSSLHHITYTSLSLPVQFQNGGLCFFCWLAAALGWLDGSAGLHSHCLRSHLISLAVSLGRRSDPSAENWVGLGRQQESEKLTANTENARQMRSKCRFNAIYMKTLGENVLEKALKNNRWCLMNLQETSALSEPSLYL